MRMHAEKELTLSFGVTSGMSKGQEGKYWFKIATKWIGKLLN